MQRTLILIAGLITMALLAVWCLDKHVGEIQTDILTRSDEALVARGLRLSASVSGQDVTLTGAVDSRQARDDAALLVAALDGVRVVDNQVTLLALPPAPTGPYVFEAVSDAGQLVLGGNVPDDAARASIVGAARQAFRGRLVLDQLTLRGKAPQDFAGAVKGALPVVARLDDGSLNFSDRRVTLRGVAANTRIMDEVERSLAASLPTGYSASAHLRLAAQSEARIAECQTSFDRIMAGRVVLFETGSARPSADSFPLLDEMAAAVKDCGGVAVEVQGHTDAQGAAQSNLGLSQRRAQAVVDYLLREGVAAGQLVARGYGESRPIAGNDSAAGRARNRRIEFRAGTTEGSEQ